MVHLENGCICCDLNEEFVKQVVTLARKGTFDYILVENTGVAEPEPVAESLVDPSIAIGDAKERLGDMVKLGAFVLSPVSHGIPAFHTSSLTCYKLFLLGNFALLLP